MSVSHSHDTLAAVLELVVGARPPVVVGSLYQVIHVLSCLDLIHEAGTPISFRVRVSPDDRQYAILKCRDQVLSQLEAWQVIQAHEHHLN